MESSARQDLWRAAAGTLIGRRRMTDAFCYNSSRQVGWVGWDSRDWRWLLHLGRCLYLSPCALTLVWLPKGRSDRL